MWNIGAEGQLIVGALAGGVVALQASPEASQLYMIWVILAAMVGGALYAGIVAWLKDKCNANEILVSLMLVYIAELFLSWAVQSPLRDPQGLGFPQSPMFEMAATLPIMIPGTRMHWVGLSFALPCSASGSSCRRCLSVSRCAFPAWRLRQLLTRASPIEPLFILCCFFPVL